MNGFINKVVNAITFTSYISTHIKNKLPQSTCYCYPPAILASLCHPPRFPFYHHLPLLLVSPLPLSPLQNHPAFPIPATTHTSPCSPPFSCRCSSLTLPSPYPSPATVPSLLFPLPLFSLRLLSPCPSPPPPLFSPSPLPDSRPHFIYSSLLPPFCLRLSSSPLLIFSLLLSLNSRHLSMIVELYIQKYLI